ncbi:MAG TPA: glycosyltransferase family A protein [Roseiflexaceae bacterium]|nr:glycosyltransferase family A protein [Roseiflexaceae bacterium]
MQDTSTHPRVSVITPCYNHSRYLAEAVASVIAQTFGGWEQIIVDDGSSDDSAAVAEQLIARYPQHSIRLLRQTNQGLSASRNNGIRLARGDYVLPLDADDQIEPSMLAETIAVLDRRREVGFVYTDVRMFGEENRIWSGGAYSLDKLRFDCPMVPMTLFRKQAWAAVGGFRGDLHPQGYEDWDFWLSLAEAGWQGDHIARPLVRYRRINSSMLAKARQHDLELRAQIVLGHPSLYTAGLVAWARQVCSPTWSTNGSLHSAGLWWRALAGYATEVARHNPRLLPKTLARPLFIRMSVRWQGYARSLAWLVSHSHNYSNRREMSLEERSQHTAMDDRR